MTDAWSMIKHDRRTITRRVSYMLIRNFFRQARRRPVFFDAVYITSMRRPLLDAVFDRWVEQYDWMEDPGHGR